MQTSPRAAALCNHTASPTVWCGHLFGTPKFWGASGHTGRLWRQVSLAVWLGPDMEPQMPTPTGQIKKVLGSSWPLSGCADGFRDTSQSGEGSLHCVWRDHAQRDATSSLSLLGVWAGLLFVSAIKRWHYRSGQISGSLGIRLTLAPLMQCTPGKFQPGPSWERSYQTTEENNSCKKVSL